MEEKNIWYITVANAPNDNARKKQKDTFCKTLQAEMDREEEI